MEPAPIDRSTLGLPTPLAQSQAWQRPLRDNGSVQHSITINNDNINKDDDQFLGNMAQEGKHSRKITTEPLTPCFFSKRRLDDTFLCETTTQQVFTTFIL